MYESYLLHPVALSTLLQRLDGGFDGNTPEATQHWLSANHKQLAVKGVAVSSLENCDAAKLLDAMFKALTEARFEYNKVEHGKEVTQWILANDDAWLTDLLGYTAKLLQT